MSDLCLHVQTSDKAYTVVEWSDGKLEALRHGQWWRDYTGDALVLQLAREVNELRVDNADLRDAIEAMPTCRCGMSIDEQCALAAEGHRAIRHIGLSLREHFAAAALQGLLASSGNTVGVMSEADYAEASYVQADAMLAVRAKGAKP